MMSEKLVFPDKALHDAVWDVQAFEDTSAHENELHAILTPSFAALLRHESTAII